VLAYPAAQCMTRDEYMVGGLSPAGWDTATVAASPGDVTGDGDPEMLVELTCPYPTSGHQETVVVFTPAVAGPRVIGVLQDDARFPDVTATPGDRSITLSGQTWGDGDANCCPEHWATLTYGWTGDGFALTNQMETRTTQPFQTGGLEDGEHVGVLTGLGSGEILVDVVQWFDGAAATQACREDNPSTDAPCRDYYYRNDNDLMRLLPVADDASLSYLDWTTMQPHTAADLASMWGGQREPFVGAAFFRFTVDGGQVTRMEERFVS
jgi:hypothetical protein